MWITTVCNKIIFHHLNEYNSTHMADMWDSNVHSSESVVNRDGTIPAQPRLLHSDRYSKKSFWLVFRHFALTVGFNREIFYYVAEYFFVTNCRFIIKIYFSFKSVQNLWLGGGDWSWLALFMGQTEIPFQNNRPTFFDGTTCRLLWGGSLETPPFWHATMC